MLERILENYLRQGDPIHRLTRRFAQSVNPYPLDIIEEFSARQKNHATVLEQPGMTIAFSEISQ